MRLGGLRPAARALGSAPVLIQRATLPPTLALLQDGPDRAAREPMHAIERFSLERHAGPYASWPRRTRVFDRGTPTKLLLPAYQLLHQFEVPGGFLLVLDDDCPNEEVTSFCLLDADLRLLSRRWLGLPYSSFLLQSIEWIDERRFVADFGQAENLHARARPRDARVRFGFVLRSRGIPYVWPRLALRDPAHWPPARARFETKSH